MPRDTGCVAVKEKFLSTIAKILKTGKDFTGSTYNYIYSIVKHCVNVFTVQNIVHIVHSSELLFHSHFERL